MSGNSLETPGSRQCWVSESNGDYYLTTLENDTLYLLEGVKKKVSRAAVEAIQSGLPASQAFGEKHIAIPVSEIRRIETAEHKDLITIKYQSVGNEKKQTVLMDEHSDRLVAVEHLMRAMGQSAQREEQPVPIAQAIIGPSLTLACVFAGTVVCYLAAADIDPNEEYNPVGRRRGMKKLAHTVMLTVGPNGMLVIGSICIAGAAFWLYRRISKPPVQTIVTRSA